MDRCPCCQARLRERSVCARCKTDLHHPQSAEQAAQSLLAQAIKSYQNGELEQSCSAIVISLQQKKTVLGGIFYEFILHQQAEVLLDLLAKKELLLARKKLYSLRLLIPHSLQLQQISAFNDYLWAQDINLS